MAGKAPIKNKFDKENWGKFCITKLVPLNPNSSAVMSVCRQALYPVWMDFCGSKVYRAGPPKTKPIVIS